MQTPRGEVPSVLLAPDSFKGSLRAHAVCDAMEQGVRRVCPDARVRRMPLSDGGEGLLDALLSQGEYAPVSLEVQGPDGDPVTARYGIRSDGTAVVEMAQASGLLLSTRRDPERASTYGTGEVMRDALERGAKRLVLGIGGSATNDAGLGMAAALGARFFDAEGRTLDPNGAALCSLDAMDLTALHPRLRDVDILVACDVDNPLYGPQGAAQSYGPQKGADADMVKRLDDGLRQFDRVVRKTLGRSVSSHFGAGAAGGLGAGLLALTDARLVSGIELVFSELEVTEAMDGVDLILGGEGRIDEQTLRGKVLAGLAREARRHGLPLIALCGQYRGDLSALQAAGVSAVFSVNHGAPNETDAFRRAGANVAEVSEQVLRLWLHSVHETNRRKHCP